MSKIGAEPLRIHKTHWDFLLQESQWMALDYHEERKWKVHVSQLLAHQAAEKIKLLERQKIAKKTAAIVSQFWLKVACVEKKHVIPPHLQSFDDSGVLTSVSTGLENHCKQMIDYLISSTNNTTCKSSLSKTSTNPPSVPRGMLAFEMTEDEMRNHASSQVVIPIRPIGSMFAAPQAAADSGSFKSFKSLSKARTHWITNVSVSNLESKGGRNVPGVLAPPSLSHDGLKLVESRSSNGGSGLPENVVKDVIVPPMALSSVKAILKKWDQVISLDVKGRGGTLLVEEIQTIKLFLKMTKPFFNNHFNRISSSKLPNSTSNNNSKNSSTLNSKLPISTITLSSTGTQSPSCRVIWSLLLVEGLGLSMGWRARGRMAVELLSVIDVEQEEEAEREIGRRRAQKEQRDKLNVSHENLMSGGHRRQELLLLGEENKSLDNGAETSHSLSNKSDEEKDTDDEMEEEDQDKNEPGKRGGRMCSPKKMKILQEMNHEDDAEYEDVDMLMQTPIDKNKFEKEKGKLDKKKSGHELSRRELKTSSQQQWSSMMSSLISNTADWPRSLWNSQRRLLSSSNKTSVSALDTRKTNLVISKYDDYANEVDFCGPESDESSGEVGEVNSDDERGIQSTQPQVEISPPEIYLFCSPSCCEAPTRLSISSNPIKEEDEDFFDCASVLEDFDVEQPVQSQKNNPSLKHNLKDKTTKPFPLISIYNINQRPSLLSNKPLQPPPLHHTPSNSSAAHRLSASTANCENSTLTVASLSSQPQTTPLRQPSFSSFQNSLASVKQHIDALIPNSNICTESSTWGRGEQSLSFRNDPSSVLNRKSSFSLSKRRRLLSVPPSHLLSPNECPSCNPSPLFRQDFFTDRGPRIMKRVGVNPSQTAPPSGHSTNVDENKNTNSKTPDEYSLNSTTNRRLCISCESTYKVPDTISCSIKGVYPPLAWSVRSHIRRFASHLCRVSSQISLASHTTMTKDKAALQDASGRLLSKSLQSHKQLLKHLPQLPTHIMNSMNATIAANQLLNNVTSSNVNNQNVHPNKKILVSHKYSSSSSTTMNDVDNSSVNASSPPTIKKGFALQPCLPLSTAEELSKVITENSCFSAKNHSSINTLNIIQASKEKNVDSNNNGKNEDVIMDFSDSSASSKRFPSCPLSAHTWNSLNTISGNILAVLSKMNDEIEEPDRPSQNSVVIKKDYEDGKIVVPNSNPNCLIDDSVLPQQEDGSFSKDERETSHNDVSLKPQHQQVPSTSSLFDSSSEFSLSPSACDFTQRPNAFSSFPSSTLMPACPLTVPVPVNVARSIPNSGTPYPILNAISSSTFPTMSGDATCATNAVIQPWLLIRWGSQMLNAKTAPKSAGGGIQVVSSTFLRDETSYSSSYHHNNPQYHHHQQQQHHNHPHHNNAHHPPQNHNIHPHPTHNHHPSTFPRSSNRNFTSNAHIPYNAPPSHSSSMHHSHNPPLQHYHNNNNNNNNQNQNTTNITNTFHNLNVNANVNKLQTFPPTNNPQTSPSSVVNVPQNRPSTQHDSFDEHINEHSHKNHTNLNHSIHRNTNTLNNSSNVSYELPATSTANSLSPLPLNTRDDQNPSSSLQKQKESTLNQQKSLNAPVQNEDLNKKQVTSASLDSSNQKNMSGLSQNLPTGTEVSQSAASTASPSTASTEVGNNNLYAVTSSNGKVTGVNLPLLSAAADQLKSFISEANRLPNTENQDVEECSNVAKRNISDLMASDSNSDLGEHKKRKKMVEMLEEDLVFTSEGDQITSGDSASTDVEEEERNNQVSNSLMTAGDILIGDAVGGNQNTLNSETAETSSLDNGAPHSHLSKIEYSFTKCENNKSDLLVKVEDLSRKPSTFSECHITVGVNAEHLGSACEAEHMGTKPTFPISSQISSPLLPDGKTQLFLPNIDFSSEKRDLDLIHVEPKAEELSPVDALSSATPPDLSESSLHYAAASNTTCRKHVVPLPRSSFSANVTPTNKSTTTTNAAATANVPPRTKGGQFAKKKVVSPPASPQQPAQEVIDTQISQSSTLSEKLKQAVSNESIVKNEEASCPSPQAADEDLLFENGRRRTLVTRRRTQTLLQQQMQQQQQQLQQNLSQQITVASSQEYSHTETSTRMAIRTSSRSRRMQM